MQQANTIDATKALADAEPILQRLLRKLCRRINAADIEDVAQSVRLTLWARIIPAFDPARGSLQNFLPRAIENALRDELRLLRKADQRRPYLLDDETPAAADYSRGAETIAADIIAKPEQHMTEHRVMVFKGVLAAAPGEPIKSIANRLHLDAGVVYDALGQIRKKYFRPRRCGISRLKS